MFFDTIWAIHWGFMNSTHSKRNGSFRFLDMLSRRLHVTGVSFRSWIMKHRIVSVIIVAITLLLSVIGALVVITTEKAPSAAQQTPVGLEYQQKLPELKSSVEKTPKDAQTRKNYGVALYATGDLEAAKIQYEEAAKLDTKDAVILNNLGNTYRDLGRIDQAINTYRKSIELSPTSLNTYANLANVQLYSKNKPQDAIATYKAGLEQLPKNTQLRQLLAVAYEQANDLENAKKTYQEIVSDEPGNSAAQAALDRLQ